MYPLILWERRGTHTLGTAGLREETGTWQSAHVQNTVHLTLANNTSAHDDAPQTSMMSVKPSA